VAIGVQVTFDAHDPGRFAVFWAEARVHRATTTARLCDLARLRPAHRAAGGTVERLRRPRRPGWGRATAVLPARAQGQECDEPGAPGPQHRRHGVRPRAASLPSVPSGRSSSPTLAAPCCVRWTSTSPRRCVHCWTSTAPSPVPAMAYRWPGAKVTERAGHGTPVGRCPSERVIHLTAREQISYSRSKADSCGMILSSGERVVPGPVHPPGGTRGPAPSNDSGRSAGVGPVHPTTRPPLCPP